MKHDAAFKSKKQSKPNTGIQTLPFILPIQKVIVLSAFIGLVSWASQSQWLNKHVFNQNTANTSPSTYIEIKPELPHFNPCCDAPSVDQDKATSLSDPAVNAKKPTSSSNTEETFQHEKVLLKVANEMNVDASLIYAVTKAESGFDSDAESQAGAVGLMQIIADKAGRDAYKRIFNTHHTPSAKELKDPYTNMKLGAAYLKLLSNHYFKNIKDKKLKKMLILAAYNWGPVNVKKVLLKRNPPRNAAEAKWVLYVRAPRETARYVSKVLKFEKEYLSEENS
jgi:hypothetical protein